MPVISKISEKKLTAIMEPSGGGFFVSCPELDLATQGKTEEEAFNDLIEMVIDYSHQYSENMEKFSKSPNRAHHLPYINLINKIEPGKIKNLFFQRLFTASMTLKSIKI